MTGALLALALSAAPPECPAGTTLAGGAPPEQYEAHCEKLGLDGRARREGPARTWYDDGGVWMDERYAEGERDGPFVEYHRNGRKAREGAYAAGRKVGRWTVWSEAGVVLEVSGWRAGVPDGAFVSYWPNGVKRVEGRHCGGPQCGVWRTFDEDGHEIGAVEYGEQAATP